MNIITSMIDAKKIPTKTAIKVLKTFKLFSVVRHYGWDRCDKEQFLYDSRMGVVENIERTIDMISNSIFKRAIKMAITNDNLRFIRKACSLRRNWITKELIYAAQEKKRYAIALFFKRNYPSKVILQEETSLTKWFAKKNSPKNKEIGIMSATVEICIRFPKDIYEMICEFCGVNSCYDTYAF
jgi:hypothetical protein